MNELINIVCAILFWSITGVLWAILVGEDGFLRYKQDFNWKKIVHFIICGPIFWILHIPMFLKNTLATPLSNVLDVYRRFLRN